jgi:acetyl-CoA carboxylase biotin carboxyl carrier protein
MTPERARQTISELIALVGNSDLIDLEVTDGDLQLRLHRPRPKVAVQAVGSPQGQIAGAPQGIAEPEPLYVRSSVVGRFYRTREIDGDPLVREGDTIAPGQVVGIVEAMNLLSEIESDAGGQVVRVLVANGERVEYGQPLIELA